MRYNLLDVFTHMIKTNIPEFIPYELDVFLNHDKSFDTNLKSILFDRIDKSVDCITPKFLTMTPYLKNTGEFFNLIDFEVAKLEWSFKHSFPEDFLKLKFTKENGEISIITFNFRNGVFLGFHEENV